jgi:hypothetical protein
MFSTIKPRAVALGTAALLCSAAYFPASAASFLIDKFDSYLPSSGSLYSVNPTNIPNWAEVEAQSDDVAIIRYPSPHNGVMQLRDYMSGTVDAMATRYNISIAGLTNISIKYDYLGHDTGAGDYLYFEWKLSNESTWRAGDSHELLSSNFQTTAAINLSNLVTKGQSSIDIRFWTDVTDSTQSCSYNRYGKKSCTTTAGSHSQTAKVDDIWLYGTIIPPPGNDNVPVPGALPLFVSGAAVFGGLLYRRKRKTDAAKQA